MRYFRLAICLTLGWFLPGLAQANPGGRGPSPPLTITVPAPLLAQVLREALPLPLEPKGAHVQGSLRVESIQDLHMQQNRISLTATVAGQDLRVETELAGQRLNLKLGNARLVLPATLELRFDAHSQTVFVTPRIAMEQGARPGDPAAAMGQALSGLSGREYSVPLGDLRPFSAQVGERQLNIAWIVKELVADNEQLLLRMVPRVSR